MTHVAVIDIGKTNAKLALVDTISMTEIAVVTRPNKVLKGPPWPHFDVEGHWHFLLDGLTKFQSEHGISAISVTTHGACGALLAADGRLAAPILDYEFTGPDDVAAEYDRIRPDFQETGSPRLPMGLNLGAQLHWMFATDPELKDRVSLFLTYPQYWGFRLTGVAASDVSSLGCHTDLWAPHERDSSSLVERLGLGGKMAPARSASDILGPVLPEITERSGLSPETPVYCGIHDSNASLLPHIYARTVPFSVVSTGTWVIAMAVGSDTQSLDPARDTLFNVSALGDPVPSARFMGGREFEILISGQYAAPSRADVTQVLSEQIMLMPATVSDSGPFAGRVSQWVGGEPRLGTGARTVAASYYLAMMTATCLGLIGHKGRIIVEGPFARNEEYCQMLVAATGCPVVVSIGSTGTSHGAAMLAAPSTESVAGGSEEIVEAAPRAAEAYARAWTQRTG